MNGIYDLGLIAYTCTWYYSEGGECEREIQLYCDSNYWYLEIWEVFGVGNLYAAWRSPNLTDCPHIGSNWTWVVGAGSSCNAGTCVTS